MVEHVRAHPRLIERDLPGKRHTLSMGTLYVPESRKDRDGARVALWIHFHGAPWLVEQAAEQVGDCAAIAIQLGSGSAVYAAPFADASEKFGEILDEAKDKLGRRLGPIYLSGWSAGYGAIREILRKPRQRDRVDGVVLLDGLHASYVGGKPGPLESQLETDSLEPFVDFGRLAIAGEKTFFVTHTEIFPGTFASTTETADYLLTQLDMPRRALLAWGALGLQQSSEAKRGKFVLRGYVGNSAPDHVDLLHGMAQFWREVQEKTAAGGAESEADEEWIRLFDADSLAGWEGDLTMFRVAEGAVVAGRLDKPIPRNEFLCTEREFGDFELRLQARLVGGPGRNAGVQFRSQRVRDSHETSGYQCDMMEGDVCLWGALYDESRRNAFLSPSDQPGQIRHSLQIERLVRYDDWNDLTIRCVGPRIQIWLNGYPTVDFTETDPDIARRGVIGLQIHGGPASEAWYRSIRLRTL